MPSARSIERPRGEVDRHLVDMREGYRRKLRELPDTIARLKKAGYQIDEAKPAVIARVEAILIEGGWMQGGHDDRGAGKAVGY